MARGILRVISPDQLSEQEREEEQRAAEASEAQSRMYETNLSSFLRKEWEMMRDHRSTTGLDRRLIQALRVYNGEYDQEKLQHIKQFGGSEVYARVTSGKCRGATALLRDVYLKAERPWSVDPTPEPTTPDDIMGSVMQLVSAEVQTLQANGQPVNDDMVRQRVEQLRTAADRAARKQARTEATSLERRLDDVLVEGGFYRALGDLLTDIPIFPFAVMKGPMFRNEIDVRWEQGEAIVSRVPKMQWKRISPFDFYWTPGVEDINSGAVIERHRYTRADIQALKGLEGYSDKAIDRVLDDYGRGGLHDWLAPTDSERSDQEGKEDPNLNRSNLIDTLEYNGPIQGRLLREWGLSEEEVPELLEDYYCQAFLIGQHVIKARISPNPRRRHNYYVTSFDKMPGGVVGFGLVDLLSDIQDVMNATLRSLVNNLSISSGPQVTVNTDRIAPDEDPDSLYPWKRWHVTSDPLGNKSDPPVGFFQPQSNAAELLGVYEKFSQIADEVSAIPRYMTGNERVGGAGKTASGLAMMLSNASKVLQNVAANIDEDVLKPLLMHLHDMLLLTDDQGMYTGDENIRVKGVAVAAQKETERARQLEWLQLTGNPVDLQLTGLDGRAAVLKQVAETLGLDGEQIVPPPEEIRARMQAPEQQGEQQMLAGGQEQGGGENRPPQQREAPRDRSAPQMGAPRTNMFQDRRTG